MSARAPFARHGDRVRVGLPADQREALARLLGDVHTMLDDASLGPDGERTAGRPPTGRDPLADLVGVDDDWLTDVARDQPLDERPAAERFTDPAMARLLPDASRDDSTSAAEFRRLTERGLRDRKRAALARARDALRRPEPVVLAADEAQALLKGLTDVRLVLAERLGLRTDEDAEMVHAVLSAAGDSTDPWVMTATLYDALTWWQEGLLRALPR